MEMFFYCTPYKLKELFFEMEQRYSLIYQPFFGRLPSIEEIDLPLGKPLHSCREFHDFGKAYSGTPFFWIYTPDDTSVETDTPVSLRFSGPPVYLKDDHVLCEGSLFLSAENKAALPRTLYKNIKHFFMQHFVKSGYCYIEPDVYSNRNEYLFVQRDYNFLSPAWCFDGSDKHIPIDIDTWYVRQGKNMECYQSPKLKIVFFTPISDLVQILLELESKYKIKYVETIYQERTIHTQNVFYSAKALENKNGRSTGARQIWAYAESSRMFICLSIDDFYDSENKIINMSSATGANNPFGDQFYIDFALAIKQSFYRLDEKHYGPFYLSSSIYCNKREMILNLNDPRFRITEHDKIIPVGRKEWEQMQKE